METWHERAVEQLRSCANADGGFGARPSQRSEPEPTALAALALGHDLTVVPASLMSTAATPLVALALPAGAARDRALDALTRTRAQPATPRGWGWTPTTYGWVEPTSWAVLALKRLRPTATALIGDGERVLAERECVGGGWNYGNRTVLGDDLRAYVQTTAAATLALQASPNAALAERGRRHLVDHWRDEPGGLTLALTLAAMRVHGQAEADAVAGALGERFDRTGFLGDTVALAWAVLASGPGIERLRITP